MPLSSIKPVAIATACETKRLSGLEITSLVPHLVLYAASMDRIPPQALTSQTMYVQPQALTSQTMHIQPQALTSQTMHIHSLFWSAFSVRSTVLHTFLNFIDRFIFVLIKNLPAFSRLFWGQLVFRFASLKD